MPEFEGEAIDEMELRVPAFVLGTDEAYTRETHIRMEIEFRIKSIRHDENRKGELVRVHLLDVEGATLKACFQPEDINDAVGGNMTVGTSIPTPEQTEELGVRIGRSSELWGNVRPLDDSVGF